MIRQCSSGTPRQARRCRRSRAILPPSPLWPSHLTANRSSQDRMIRQCGSGTPRRARRCRRSRAILPSSPLWPSHLTASKSSRDRMIRQCGYDLFSLCKQSFYPSRIRPHTSHIRTRAVSWSTRAGSRKTGRWRSLRCFALNLVFHGLLSLLWVEDSSALHPDRVPN
jgi:hypothetical protein